VSETARCGLHLGCHRCGVRVPATLRDLDIVANRFAQR